MSFEQLPPDIICKLCMYDDNICTTLFLLNKKCHRSISKNCVTQTCIDQIHLHYVTRQIRAIIIYNGSYDSYDSYQQNRERIWLTWRSERVQKLKKYYTISRKLLLKLLKLTNSDPESCYYSSDPFCDTFYVKILSKPYTMLEKCKYYKHKFRKFNIIFDMKILGYCGVIYGYSVGLNYMMQHPVPFDFPSGIGIGLKDDVLHVDRSIISFIGGFGLYFLGNWLFGKKIRQYMSRKG